MKLGFSTLGCPLWDFKEIITSAKDLNYNGVEIRGLQHEIYAPASKQFSDDKISETVSYLDSLCIEIPMLTTAAEIAVQGKEESTIKEAYDYIKLAEKLKVPYIRLLCTNSAAPNGGDVDLAKRLYQEIAEYASLKGVTPLIETNGIFSDTHLVKEFMESIKSENKGVLWDIHHPYRYNSEEVEKTIENIGKYVKYCHVKDSVIEKGQVVYRMTGYGDVPIKEAVVNLRNIGYDGYLTFEWVKRWNRNLEEPGIALCQYVGYMKTL